MICVFHMLKQDRVAPEWTIATLVDRNMEADDRTESGLKDGPLTVRPNWSTFDSRDRDRGTVVWQMRHDPQAEPLPVLILSVHPASAFILGQIKLPG